VASSEHPRLAALPHRSVLGVEVAVAVNRRARLLGLAGIEFERAGDGLLIPRCASVHSFGMRFALDLFFLDAAEQPLMVCRSLPPRRLAWCRGAVAVLEVPGGEFSSPAT
jgi:uncharacterized protein